MSFANALLFATAAAATCAAAATLSLLAMHASGSNARDVRLARATNRASRPITAYGRHNRRKY
ncbi:MULTISPECIES: hypothetical protein [Burkholderia cepacia complex]|uniref:hypothetical protein n=1 Tax=Burkholderia cepacia complex TaxID=87882 RepID=UPI000A97D096|nr:MULTISPECIES: hypothetical protein [Burkholderia cepacia complex]MBR8189070.1 hypothetical protein [Burkholderia vietnamiensis]HDR9174291.1 hypothetical protein [Burkholderia vietnamiensis]